MFLLLSFGNSLPVRKGIPKSARMKISRELQNFSMAQTERIVSKFVSQKVNKIRWQPKSKQGIHESNVFATGSWDDHVSWFLCKTIEIFDTGV